MKDRPICKRRWIRGLVVAFSIAAAAPMWAQEPVNVQATRKEFGDAYRKEDWDRAAELGLELERLLPNSSREQYNLACVMARKGDVEAALGWLKKAAANGFCRISILDVDPELEGVRDLPGYQIVHNMVSENTKRRRDLVYRTAAANPPLTVLPKKSAKDEPRPLIVVLHGFGGTPDDFPMIWGPAAERLDAILVVPHGPRRIGIGHGWVDLDEADAVVEATLDYAMESFEVDRDRVVLTGFSEGAYMAMALGIRHPDLFAGVIPVAGGYIPEIDAPPKAGAGSPRFYFMVGSLDRVAKQARLAASDFEAAGYEVDFRMFPDTGHEFPRRTTQELGRALRFVLGE
jgi:predicted esterase